MEKSKHLMVGIGEVLWDVLPQGRQFGGSPVNVVYHCQAAGIPSVIISAIGNDQDGQDILEELRNRNISKDYIQISDQKTGIVTVKLNDGIPDFTIHPDVAWDKIRWNSKLEKLAKEADAVAFGSLPQRDQVSRDTMSRFIEMMKPDSIRVFDINLRQDFHSAELVTRSLELANILKINDEELPILAKYLCITGTENEILNAIFTKFNLHLIAYTKGADGSLLLTKNQRSEKTTPKVNIKDTVGAGDSFTGVLIAGLLNKTELKQIHRKATEVAAWVCENHGAMPKYSTKNESI